MSYISVIETAVPDHGYTQETLTSFYLKSTDDLVSKRKIKIVAGKTGIEKRYSVIADFDKEPEDFEFFEKNRMLLPEPGLTQRMQLYQKHVMALSIKATVKIRDFDKIKDSITHLITLTCTGLLAPGLDVERIRELCLNPSIERSSVNFMGCNPAVIAYKNADNICRSHRTAKVPVACTELCTIHFQKQYNDDYLLSNLLFSDGTACVLVTSEAGDRYAHKVEIDSFNSLILHNSYADMAWQLSKTMQLRYV